MNLVGKIFIVVILVLALVFMAITMAVYTAQRNWREVVMSDSASSPGLKIQKEKLEHDNSELKAAKDRLEKEYAAEKNAKQQSLVKLKNELDVAQRDSKRLEAERAGLEKEKRDAVAAMTATQKNASDYRVELEKNRTLLTQAHQDRDQHWAQVVKKTDEFNQAVNELDALKKRTAELAKDVAKAEQALRAHGLSKDSETSKTPPKVDAVVTSVAGDGLIEISLGSDAGLRKGHLLEVFRTGGGQDTYVGRVEVVKTDPSKSVCKADPKYLSSNIQVNDRVANKID
jgi:hypothetical protein